MKDGQLGRLAMRKEGRMWNAYYADNETMEDAVFLGGISMALAENSAVKSRFMDLMRDVVTDTIRDHTGINPSWGGPKSAPEHERSGNA